MPPNWNHLWSATARTVRLVHMRRTNVLDRTRRLAGVEQDENSADRQKQRREQCRKQGETNTAELGGPGFYMLEPAGP